MSKRKFFPGLVMVFIAASLLCFGGVLDAQDPVKVVISDPQVDGMEVGMEKGVSGTAVIPSGNYLWILVHRVEGFEDVWWPQNEGKIDAVAKTWKVNVVFGNEKDIGYQFEIAAIIVNETEHMRLKDYRIKAMTSGHWPPIAMPPTVSAPFIRMVKKVSHH